MIWLRTKLYLNFHRTIKICTTLRKKPFENVMGKGEKTCTSNQHFLLFPQRFLSYQRKSHETHLICRL